MIELVKIAKQKDRSVSWAVQQALAEYIKSHRGEKEN
jgi:predicted transcriptional regulator